MRRRLLIGAVGGAAAVTALLGVGTHSLSGARTTGRSAGTRPWRAPEEGHGT